LALSTLTALRNATIFTGEAMVEGHALLIKDGKIVDIIGNGKIPAEAETITYDDALIVPGFIDAQVNGGNNILFNNTPTMEACLGIASAHQKHGTTRLLPTFITDKPEATSQAIAAMRDARKTNPAILGIHIEGPHLGQERRGVHKAEYIRTLTTEDMAIYQPQPGEVVLMTIAPETVPPEQIKALYEKGIILSIGHTNAIPEQIHAAREAGTTGYTHLFNGMGKPSPEGTNPADTALKDKAGFCGIIVDGFHVKRDLVELALKAKPAGMLFLVSDAMPPAACAKPKSFSLYGEEIHVEVATSGLARCVNHEGKLAGSAITLLDAIRVCVNQMGIPLEEALRMASLYPAKFLGLDKKLGSLLPGFDADITVLDSKLNCKAAWTAGQRI
jgi:N-acetylglucosamine-6-phosphate deacetylase